MKTERAMIEEAMQRYQANGGKVQQVPTGARTIDDGLRHCRCGCRGNYTEHSMRLGEMGK